MRRIGYSFFVTQTQSPVPDWFANNMTDYLERFYPAYISRYLDFDITVESAPEVVLPGKKDSQTWLQYMGELHALGTWGYDAFFTVTDVPHGQMGADAFTAGETFWKMDPIWIWCSMNSWDDLETMRLAAPSNSYMQDRWYAQMLGRKPNVGIDSLVVMGHEISHCVLLWLYGLDASASIDGGSRTGLVLLDQDLNPAPEGTTLDDTSFYRYAVQRVKEELPYQSNMGAYGNGPLDPSTLIRMPANFR